VTDPFSGIRTSAALTLLLYAYFTVGLPALASWALLLLLIAAAGGAFLNLNYHWKMLPPAPEAARDRIKFRDAS